MTKLLKDVRTRRFLGLAGGLLGAFGLLLGLKIAKHWVVGSPGPSFPFAMVAAGLLAAGTASLAIAYLLGMVMEVSAELEQLTTAASGTRRSL